MTDVTCKGFLELRHVIIKSIVDFNTKPEYFCEEVYKTCDTDYYVENKPEDYVKKILADKPKDLANDDFVQNLYEEMKQPGRKTFKALHLADVHMDLYYEAGSNWNCDEVICCRSGSGTPSAPEFEARPTGEYYCDLPYTTLDLMGQYINKEVKPDVVLWTGDITPHDQWKYTLEEAEHYTSNFTGWMKEALGSYSLFPIEGNHDFGVANSQNFTTTDPMIPFDIENWNQWLTPEAIEVFKESGFYSEYFHLTDGTQFPKTRLVAVNTQSCYIMNFYLIETHKDGGDQLAWFENLMKEMEAAGETAILIGHVPTGDDCLNNWSIRFNALLERYQHIIRTQLYGHVHLENFSTTRGVSTDKPVSNQFWASSGTPFTNHNPAFRVVTIDQETLMPVNLDTYIFNLTDREPEWKFHHDYLNFYDLEDLSPASMTKLSEKIRDDEHTALVYENIKGQREVGFDLKTCDETCRKDLFCQNSQAINFHKQDCSGKPRIDWTGSPVWALMETLEGNWYDVSLPKDQITILE
jgi:sphingomyelin phosphodiesterase